MNPFIEKFLISNKYRTVDLILSILSNSTLPTTKNPDMQDVARRALREDRYCQAKSKSLLNK